jgi:hypothetical protein
MANSHTRQCRDSSGRNAGFSRVAGPYRGLPNLRTPPALQCFADLEVGDTAGLETCATGSGAKHPCMKDALPLTQPAFARAEQIENKQQKEQ